MGYLWEAFEPGTLTQAKRLGIAYSGLTNEYGKKYNVSDEVLGFFGLRISEVDIEQSMQFKGYGYSNEIRDNRRIYNKVKNRKGRVPEQEIRGAKAKANQALRGTWEEAKRDWEAAYRLGLSTSEIKKQLENGNLPKWFIESLENDRFREFNFD